MANPEQLERLKQGVEEWNKWRDQHLIRRVDLSHTDLVGANLFQANLRWANLKGTNLERADLIQASLDAANLKGARLMRANLFGATLQGADLQGADLQGADLQGAFLAGANLNGLLLEGAMLKGAWLKGAGLKRAGLKGANLEGANLERADLEGANLRKATLVETSLENADLRGCHVYGIAAWDVRLAGAKQSGLVITDKDAAEITVDNLQVAQFIYLLLNNENIRRVIDTITSKVVLILGRFSPERKAVLDALRDALRTKNYSPVVFDFEKPASRNLTETIRVLAGMARFVIADITDAKSIPQELMAIIPDLPLTGRRNPARRERLKSGHPR